VCPSPFGRVADDTIAVRVLGLDAGPDVQDDGHVGWGRRCQLENGKWSLSIEVDE
jgi:hypothetical protein